MKRIFALIIAFVMVFGMVGMAQAIPINGLVGEWLFNGKLVNCFARFW